MEIEKVNTPAKDYPAAAFVQYAPEDGLMWENILALRQQLAGPDGDELIPVTYEADNANVFGFVRYVDAEELDFNIQQGSPFANAVLSIVNDKKNESETGDFLFSSSFLVRINYPSVFHHSSTVIAVSVSEGRVTDVYSNKGNINVTVLDRDVWDDMEEQDRVDAEIDKILEEVDRGKMFVIY